MLFGFRAFLLTLHVAYMSASNAPQPSNRVENAHSDSIWSVAWSGSERLLSGSLDGSIRLWNSRSLDKALFATSKERVGVNSIATSDDGRYCVACYQVCAPRTSLQYFLVKYVISFMKHHPN